MSLAPTAFLLGYFIVFIGIIHFLLRKWRSSRGKKPFWEDSLLLRRPGEFLEQEIHKLNDSLQDKIAHLMLFPALGFMIPFLVTFFGWQVNPWPLFLSAAAMAGLGLILPLRKLWKLVDERHDLRLGLYGERWTADHLEPLRTMGFSIFHDVPCRGATKWFNLDHVVVGNGGVAIVETKSRSKYVGSNGKLQGEVFVQNGALHWPRRGGGGTFEDTETFDQVRNAGKWLAEFLKDRLKVTVVPFLAVSIPGWKVTRKENCEIVALNPREDFPGFIKSRSTGTLSESDLQKIAEHLTALNRTVSFDEMI